MARAAIIGDGPAGLSAALLLAKNGQETVVYAQDETLMHSAELHNYLGIPEVSGTEFQQVARQQVAAVGAQLRETAVEEITARDGGFTVRAGDDEHEVDYVVLAGGRASQRLARALGAEERDRAVAVDQDGRTSVPGLYAAGHLVRPERSQAIISAGWGAAAALDVLSREAGRDVHDWDVPS